METIRELFYTLLQRTDENYKRYFFDKINFDEKLIGVLGDRGIGKTTFLLQYLKGSALNLNEKLYINADYISLSGQNIFELAREFEKEGGKLLVIDEIHKIENYENALKLIYDYLDIKVIFSGSSAIRLEHSKADLSRRAALYRFQGLNFREFLELKLGKKFDVFTLEEITKNHIDITYSLTKEFKPFEHWKEYLEFGYYPFYFSTPEANFHIKLNEAINATIEFDLAFIFNIEPKYSIKLKQLVALVCGSKPYELNISKLAQKIEINRNTLYQYIHYLSMGNIFNIIHAKNRGDNIFTKPQKLYLSNTNLNFAYCKNTEIGTIREAFFVTSIRESHTVYYSEIGDFLVADQYIFEIGGKNKSFDQINGVKNSFLAVDDIEIGNGNRIPLWLFGFLY